MQKKTVILLISLLLLVGFVVIAAPKAKKPAINPPSNLEAIATSSSRIDLSWQDNSDNETGFKIERGPDGENFSEIDEVGENITTYSDTGLDSATTYYYQVRAFKPQGPNKVVYSDYSNIASATTFDVPPDAPINLTATASTSDYAALGWQDNSDNEDGFSIERSDNGIDYNEIATTSENIASYDDYSVNPGSSYYYQVRAFNEIGYSGYTNVASTTVPDNIPDDPTNLGAETIVATTTIYVWVDWLDNSDNEDGFNLERSINGVDFGGIATTSENVAYYSDYDVATSTTYYYQVRAFNEVGYSGYSNVASTTTP